MAFDLKGKIEEIANKIKTDKELQAQFKTEPIKAVESLLGVDLPDDMVSGVKAKLTADKAGDMLGGLKKLF